MLKAFKLEWKVKDNRSRAFMLGGVLFMILALVGVAVPVLPQVPFAIISAMLFAKGSALFHFKVRHNKYFGQPVRDWEDHHVVRTKLKIFSTLAMIGGAAISHWKLESPWPLIVDAIFAASIAFIWTRKSKPHFWSP